MKKSLLFCLVAVCAALGATQANADPWGPHHRGPEWGRPWHEPFFRGPVDHWRAGYWYNGWHGGYTGWWWVVDGSWYLYGARVAEYPDVYTQPVVVVTQGQAPVVYQTVQPTPAPTTIVTTPGTTTVTTTAPVVAPAAAPVVATTATPSKGAVVNFKDAAPAPVEATQASSTFIDKQGRTCREYQTQIVIGGETKAARGTACLDADGSWRVVK